VVSPWLRRQICRTGEPGGNSAEKQQTAMLRYSHRLGRTQRDWAVARAVKAVERAQPEAAADWRLSPIFHGSGVSGVTDWRLESLTC